MFATQTEALKYIDTLQDRYREITFQIMNRQTAALAAVIVAGRPSEMLVQMNAVYQAGWAIALRRGGGLAIISTTTRNTLRRSAVGMNRTSYGY